MSAVKVEGGNDNFTFDPSVEGYSSGVFFATVVGAPAISGGNLRLTSARVASTASFQGGLDLEFTLNIPTDPTGGQARVWGLRTPYLGNRGAAYFEIAGTVFRMRVYAENGTTLLLDKTGTWDTANWTNQFARYKIRVSSMVVQFLVNEVLQAEVKDLNETMFITPGLPWRIDLENQVADNMDLDGLAALKVLNLA